ncbi:hypothetical protein UPYG_G00177750 [Umbra pygmaea]|uniref:DUF1279 domain-containing protein n=1 Tax=Umbra pygmaea TaxID=75934 RepID=A0ABD0WQS2_UMBPY
MLLRLGAKQPATVLVQNLNSTAGTAFQAGAQLKTDRLAWVTWQLHNTHSVKCSPRFCVFIGSRDQSSLSPDGKLKTREMEMFPVKQWSAFRFVTMHRGRITPFGSNFSSKSNHASVFCSNHTYVNTSLTLYRTNGGHNTQKHADRHETVLFTSDANVCCQGFYPISTVQVRALSSVAAASKRVEDTDGDQTTNESSARGPEDPQPPEPEKSKPSRTEQLKKVFKEYGAVGVSFHICISLMSLGMFYLAVSSGIDMAAVLYKIGFSEALVQSKLAAGTSTFVLAYAVHKLFAPLRISITLVSVPLLVRYLRKTGLFKTPNSPSP